MKRQLSKIKIQVSVGFIYWLSETHNLRGLKNLSIEEFPNKLKNLNDEYNNKYPNGLVGWNRSSKMV
jgi:hypothetical protein